eukprot:gnl/MRDRNA2_/MRDRNA2_36208_c0_seq1.p1 gnl/MRDRNA2_/MRDRNA2_36208_c0~~gnl/MRDRNA2_/MRDRNA2_36208_c0_seq1.p1  ORF type:complete len:919 (+),score=150.42 gnl/MRDRNA2_/MRDRNA2_36208_c0_seq1:97-2853(+)
MQSYEVLRFLGRGASGEVSLARLRKDGTLCALKRVDRTTAAEADLSASREEVRILKALHHPCVLQYYDSFECDRCLMISTEYVDNGDLQQLISRRASCGAGGLEMNPALSIFSQISSAVAYVHDNRVLHRDLKPSNIFLTSLGVVKVGDFGASKLLTDTTLSQRLTRVGSPCYMAPEVMAQAPYGAKADAWSLGVLLYELLSLHRPFQGRSLGELVMKISLGQYPPLEASATSPTACALVAQMLSVDSASRPFVVEVIKTQLLSPFLASLQRCAASVQTLLKEDMCACGTMSQQGSDSDPCSGRVSAGSPLAVQSLSDSWAGAKALDSSSPKADEKHEHTSTLNPLAFLQEELVKTANGKGSETTIEIGKNLSRTVHPEDGNVALNPLHSLESSSRAAASQSKELKGAVNHAHQDIHPEAPRVSGSSSGSAGSSRLTGAAQQPTPQILKVLDTQVLDPLAVRKRQGTPSTSLLGDDFFRDANLKPLTGTMGSMILDPIGARERYANEQSMQSRDVPTHTKQSPPQKRSVRMQESAVDNMPTPVDMGYAGRPTTPEFERYDRMQRHQQSSWNRAGALSIPFVDDGAGKSPPIGFLKRMQEHEARKLMQEHEIPRTESKDKSRPRSSSDVCVRNPPATSSLATNSSPSKPSTECQGTKLPSALSLLASSSPSKPSSAGQSKKFPTVFGEDANNSTFNPSSAAQVKRFPNVINEIANSMSSKPSSAGQGKRFPSELHEVANSNPSKPSSASKVKKFTSELSDVANSSCSKPSAASQLKRFPGAFCEVSNSSPSKPSSAGQARRFPIELAEVANIPPSKRSSAGDPRTRLPRWPEMGLGEGTPSRKEHVHVASPMPSMYSGFGMKFGMGMKFGTQASKSVPTLTPAPVSEPQLAGSPSRALRHQPRPLTPSSGERGTPGKRS